MAYPPASLKFSSYTFGVKTTSYREASPYSLKTTSYDFMGDAWVADVSVSHVGRQASNVILAWLASLKGPAGSFRLPVFDYSGPAGVSSNPEVAATALARSGVISLQMVGADAFEVGEYFTLDGHLHVVTAAPAPLIGGVQSLTVWPRLRADVALGDPVEALAPYAVWALADQENAFSRQSSRARSQRLKLVEVI